MSLVFRYNYDDNDDICFVWSFQLYFISDDMASQTQGIQQLLIAEKRAAEKVYISILFLKLYI